MKATVRVEVVQVPPERTWKDWAWAGITFCIGLFVVINRL